MRTRINTRITWLNNLPFGSKSWTKTWTKTQQISGFADAEVGPFDVRCQTHALIALNPETSGQTGGAL